MTRRTLDGMTTTLITGGTGTTGRRIAERVTTLSRPIRFTSRSGAVPYDWNQPDTWGPAVHGCRSVYLAYAPDLAFPEATESFGRFAETAVAAGTTGLMLLSGRGEHRAQRAGGRDLRDFADYVRHTAASGVMG